MKARQIKEIVGLMMVGEGVVAMLHPQRYPLFWHPGPTWWRRMITPFVERPALTCALGAVEAAVGLCLASRQLSNHPISLA